MLKICVCQRTPQRETLGEEWVSLHGVCFGKAERGDTWRASFVAIWPGQTTGVGGQLGFPGPENGYALTTGSRRCFSLLPLLYIWNILVAERSPGKARRICTLNMQGPPRLGAGSLTEKLCSKLAYTFFFSFSSAG